MKSLKSQFIVTNILQGSTLFLGLLRTFALSKILLPEEFGVLSYLLGMLPFLLHITTFGAFQFLLKIAGDSKRAVFHSYKVAFLLNLTLSLLVIGVFLSASDYFLKLLSITAYKYPLLIILITNFLYSSSTLFGYVAYGLGKTILYSFIEFLKISIWIVFALLYYYFFQPSGQIYIYTFIFIGALIPFLFVVRNYRLLILKLETKYFKLLFTYCIPLLPYFFAVWGITFLIRSIIANELGTFELGIFAVSYGLIEMTTNIVSNFSSALKPKFYANKEKSDASKWLNLSILLSLIFLMVIGPIVLLLRDWIIETFTSDKYASAGKYLLYLAIIPAIKIMIDNLQQIYLKESKTRYIAIIYTISTLLGVTSTKLLAIKFGNLDGVFISIVLTYGTLLLFLSPKIKEYFNSFAKEYFLVLLIYSLIFFLAANLFILNESVYFQIITLLTVMALTLIPMLFYLKNRIQR